MAFDLKRRLYESLPGWAKAPVGWIPFHVLAGPSYRATLARGRALDGGDRAAIDAWQEQALRSMLEFATRQVPAYESLRGGVLEEAYEVVAAIDEGDVQALQEELGDLLLQVVLQTQIATEEGEFKMAAVIEGIDIGARVATEAHLLGTLGALTQALVQHVACRLWMRQA